MSESTPAQSGQAGSQSATEDNLNLEANRSAEEYAARLKETAQEAKKYRQTNAELKAKLEQLEKERLESQGKFQEIAQKEKERAEKLEKDLQQTRAMFAMRSVTSQIESEAARLGCVDTNALIKLLDLNELEVDDEFKVDGQSLKAVLDRATKEKSYLFQKQATQPKDLPPTPGNAAAFKPSAPKTLGEKMALLAEVMKKGG